MRHCLMISLYNSTLILTDGTQVNFKGKICSQAAAKSSLQPNTVASIRNKPGRKQQISPAKSQMSSRQTDAKTIDLPEDKTLPITKEAHNLAKHTQATINKIHHSSNEISPINYDVEDSKPKKRLLAHANRLKPAIAKMLFESQDGESDNLPPDPTRIPINLPLGR